VTVEDKEVVRLASAVKDRVEIAGDTYDIRKLSWRSLKKAADAMQVAQAAHMRSIGGEIFKVIGDASTAAAQEASQKRAEKLKTREGRAEERYAPYDVEEILVAGLERVNGQPASRPFINDELDKATAEALHRRIIDLSLGPLDKAEEEEVAGKS